MRHSWCYTGNSKSAAKAVINSIEDLPQMAKDAAEKALAEYDKGGVFELHVNGTNFAGEEPSFGAWVQEVSPEPPAHA